MGAAGSGSLGSRRSTRVSLSRAQIRVKKRGILPMTEILPPCKLFYIRHGETEWSLSRQHTGATDLTLTPNGETQSRALVPWIANAGFSRVFSSPRLRARQTCELSGASDRPEIENDAAEWNYGDYEGLRSSEIRLERPTWNIFRDGCPHGEAPEEIAARADRLIARFRAMSGKVALFSHGHFGVVLAARWIGLDITRAGHFRIEPASIGILTMDRDHSDTPIIEVWNAASKAPWG
jgi:broad specificity phosphatase PhoE